MPSQPNLIDQLRDVQQRCRYLPEPELKELAGRMKLPLYELQGVASFYPEFHLKSPPRVTIEVCNSLPCLMRRSEELFRAIEKAAVQRNEASRCKPDTPEVLLRRCPCLGACDEAPAATLNGHLQVCRSDQDLQELYRTALALIAGTQEPTDKYPVGSYGKFLTDPYGDGEQHFGALKGLVQSGNYDGVLETVDKKMGNLRGMGGAGKAAHRKWKQVKDHPASPKYIVCNADESEPGTLKDREILRKVPHLLVEGMIIAGLTVGAAQGYIYLRHEYKAQLNMLKDAIDRARSLKVNGAPLLGDNVGGSGKTFDLQIFVSPGGYIMGEATALLEALEGKRGQPRNQMVDLGNDGLPSFNGLWGKPTLVNNVETFIYVPGLLLGRKEWAPKPNGPAELQELKGWEWFNARGVNGSKGLKWVSVCGDVERPGVFEVSMGTRYREVIEKAGVRGGWSNFKAFAPSGPTYGFLPGSLDAGLPADAAARHRWEQIQQTVVKTTGGEPPKSFLDMTIDFHEGNGFPAGSGAIIVLDQSRCMVEAALNFTRFFRNESCGKCVPCRVGSQKMVDMVKLLRAGEPGAADMSRHLREIDRLDDVLTQLSICGLGKVVPVPLQSVLRYWPGEVESHMLHRRCPANICFNPRRYIA